MKKKKFIELFGKLEQIAQELEPTRSQIFYFLGTVRQFPRQEILECIETQTRWNNYSLDQVGKMLDFVQKRPTTKDFFSSYQKAPKQKSCLEKKIWRFNKGFVRTTASNEVALDIDDAQTFQNGVIKFRNLKLKGNCRTWQGAKGGHISLFFEKPVTSEFREKIRKCFGGDPGQINISVEGKPHQKTGNIVWVIAENKGLNKNEVCN